MKNAILRLLITLFIFINTPAWATPFHCEDIFPQTSQTQINRPADTKPTLLQLIAQKVTSVLASPFTRRYSPKLDQPILPLGNPMPDPRYFVDPDLSETTYWDGPRAEPGSTLWRSFPYETEKQRQLSGPDIVFDRIAAFFGFETSQPRITSMRNQTVVLEKVLDSWRGYDSSQPGDSGRYQEARLLGAFIGGFPLVVTYKDNDTLLAVRGFSSVHFSEPPVTMDIEDVMRAVDVTQLPITHPWRRLTVENAQVFLTQLKHLTNSTLEVMIAEAQLPGRMPLQLREWLIRRRDILTNELLRFVEHIDPSPNITIQQLAPVLKLMSEDMYLRTDDPLNEAYLRRWTPELIQLAENYLSQFVAGKILDTDLAVKIFRILFSIGNKKIAPINLDLYVPLLSRALNMGDKGEKVAYSLFLNILYSPSANPLITPTVELLVQRYHSGQAQSIHDMLVKGYLWHVSNDRNPHVENFLSVVKIIQSSESKFSDELIEILFLSLLKHCLDKADFADKVLSKGGGFHNAQDVNKYMRAADLAIQDFITLGTPRNLTARFDFDRLQEVLSALQYDSLGRRAFGQSITIEEVYGWNGATRPEGMNPYQMIINYLAGKIERLSITVQQTE